MRTAAVVFATVALVALSALTPAVAARRRAVSCQGTSLPVTAADLHRYSIGLINETLNFDALVYLGTAGSNGVDVTTFFVTLNDIAVVANKPGATMDVVLKAWFNGWLKAVEGAEKLLAHAKTEQSRAHLSLQISSYSQLQLRYAAADDQVANAFYKASTDIFTKVAPYAFDGVTCTNASFPWQDPRGGTITLHAYLCTPKDIASKPAGSVPGIVTVNGFDGTAEVQVHAIGVPMAARGYAVLLVEGPGQGLVARQFPKHHFLWTWEAVTDAAVAQLRQAAGGQVNASRVALWGESFGGYLSPRAFAKQKTGSFAALVANGGVMDFYQTSICKAPQKLIDMYLEDSPRMDGIIDGFMARAGKQRIDLDFFLTYGQRGLGFTNWTALIDALEPFALVPGGVTPSEFAGKPVFVYNPQYDTLVGNQSALFWEAMVAPGGVPSNAKSTISRVPASMGGGLHCGVGSSSAVTDLLVDWLSTAM